MEIWTRRQIHTAKAQRNVHAHKYRRIYRRPTYSHVFAAPLEGHLPKFLIGESSSTSRLPSGARPGSHVVVIVLLIVMIISETNTAPLLSMKMQTTRCKGADLQPANLLHLHSISYSECQ